MNVEWESVILECETAILDRRQIYYIEGSDS